jgi:hypothetical protein
MYMAWGLEQRSKVIGDRYRVNQPLKLDFPVPAFTWLTIATTCTSVCRRIVPACVLQRKK